MTSLSLIGRCSTDLTSMKLLLPLLFVATAHAVSISSIVEYGKVSVEKKPFDFRSMIDDATSGNRCSEDRLADRTCKCNGDECECCTNITPFAIDDAEVCLTCQYCSKHNVYKCDAKANGKTFIHGRVISRKGNGNTDQTCFKKLEKGSVKADVCIIMECQKEEGSAVYGCARMTAKYEIDKLGIEDEVDLSFGCYKLKA